MPSEEKIVVKTKIRPGQESADQLVDWFCKVFDLATREDQPEPELLKDIVSHSVVGQGITSLELTDKHDMPRSTVIYHLNRFIATGIVIRKGRRYFLRAEDMEGTIEELKSDMMMEFNKMLEFAGKLDEFVEREADAGRKRRKRR